MKAAPAASEVKCEVKDECTAANESPRDVPTSKDWSHEIPDETWLNILSRLTYPSMLMVKSTCRKLNRLLDDASFSEALFHVPPVKQKLTPADSLALHPMLEVTNCVDLSTSLAGIFKIGDFDDDFREYNAYDYPACDEFATEPACTMMLVNVHVGKQVSVSDVKGIKVKRVLKALAKFWKQPPPKATRERFAAYVDEGQDVTWRSTLLDHCGFAGWEGCEVMNDGTVELTAFPFDS